MEPAPGPVPALPRAEAAWPSALTPCLRINLKRQIVDPLAQLVVLALNLVLGLVDPSPELAHLFLQRIYTGQQLSDQLAATRLCRRRAGSLPRAASTATGRLVLSVLSSCRS